jgi:predicted Zn-ribbon and HTH transcriptional regulator
MEANTVGKLIKLLSEYPKDMIITNQANQPFIHIINRQGEALTLSTEKPIGYCRKCGDYAYEELNRELDYPGQCPTCDENLYNFEINSLENGSK